VNMPPLDPHEGRRPDDEPIDPAFEPAPREEAPGKIDLERGAPRLAGPDARQLNRNVVLLAGLLVAVLVLGIAWMMTAQGSAPSKKAPAEEEALVVPAIDGFPGHTGGVPPTVMPAHQPAEPIPLRSMDPSRHRSPEPMQAAPALPAAPRAPTLRERRMGADASTAGAALDPTAQALAALNQFSAAAANPNGQAPAVTAADNERGRRAMSLDKPATLLLRGTVIRCVLETKIVTDVPGFTSCVVTEPVYSFNGRQLLLAKGSRVMGQYEGAPTFDRVAVIWDRVVTPGGIDVTMASPGIDTLGGAGHPGHTNAHWGSRIGAALMISLFSDAFKYTAAKHGPKQTSITNGVVTQNPFESNTAETIQQLAEQAVQRSANRPATVTINQGTVLAIYVARDVDFSGVVARQ
jgi:Type IV secretory pathway, VirB10 components